MSRSRILWIAVAALTIAGLACSAAERTPTPMPVPTATEAPQATETSVPTPKPAATSTKAPVAPTATKAPAAPTAAPSAEGVLFDDDFGSQQTSESNGWDFTSTENVERSWSANKYTFAVNKKNYLGYGTPDGEYDDFGAEVEAQTSSAYARYGIRFRIQGGDNASYYIFVVTTDGKYYVDTLLNGAWTDVSPVATTASQYINKGKAKNTLGVLAQGSQISLYINRTLVKTFSDDSIDNGLIGVLAGPGDNASTEVTFSRFTVLTAEKAKADWGATPATGTTQPTATAKPAATATKTSGGGSGNGVITVRNTFDGACQINLWGQKEAVIRAEGNSSKSLSLPPGTYGVHAAVDIGEVDLSYQIKLPPGGYCTIYCTKATKSVSAGCGQ
jgi:hypothetical protein